MAEFSELVGKTIVSIEGMESESEEIKIDTADGLRFRMYHEQDCCESVYVQDVCGDVSDLIGSPILVAEEATSVNDPPEDTFDDSYTWTFYKLDTARGGVTIRWLGRSNGYYSESVDISVQNYSCAVK